MTAYFFDADEFIRQMREANARAIETARATITDPDRLAGIEAQSALLPAKENWARVYIGLREAGRPDEMIAAVGGALAGSVLHDLILNSEDPKYVSAIFLRNIELAISRQNNIDECRIGVRGVPGGRA